MNFDRCIEIKIDNDTGMHTDIATDKIQARGQEMAQ